MFLDSQSKFRLKQAKDNGAFGLYNGYLSVVEKTKSCVNAESVEYLRLFVQYDYKECIHIIRERNNTRLTLYPYEREYLYLLEYISAYHLDRDEFVEGLLWAMKTIDVCNLLYPTMNIYKRHEILNSLSAAEFYREYYPKYPIQEMYNNFHLEWELEDSLHLDYQFPLNDN